MISHFSTLSLAFAGKLDGKVTLVTGATSGIGEACAKKMHAEGSNMVFADLSIKKELEADLAKMNEERPNSAMFVKLDVTSENDWKAAMKTVHAKFGKMDVIVNNAGIASTWNIEKETLAGFKKIQAVNTEGVFLGSKYAVEAMKKNGGSIINMCSIEGLVGDKNCPAYTASKGAVRIMSKSIALHCAKKGYKIRVNTVHPGFIGTPMILAGISPKAHKALVDLHPIGRLGTPEDIANGCIFLASEDSSFMTGSELVMDGGYTAQ